MNPLGIGQYYTDLDILRQIRDANPTSKLPSLWLDTEDPYTQWEGVVVDNVSKKVITLNVGSRRLTTIHGINKLKQLRSLVCVANNLTSVDISDMPNLTFVNIRINNINYLNLSNTPNIIYLQARENKLTNIDLYGLTTSLYQLEINNNQLISLPTLTSKGSIADYNFTNNYFPTAERIVTGKRELS